MPVVLDRTNRRIVAELQADARLSLAELGRRVNLSPPAVRELDRIRQVARETPEVVECHRITGEDCFFLKLHLRAIDDLEDVLDRFTPYGRTTTSIIHSSPVDRRPLPLDPPEENA